MFRPTGDFMFVKVVSKFEGIVMPDNVQPSQGDVFRVEDIGPGLLNEDGRNIPSGTEVGDIVYLVGRILRLPTEEGEILVARASDVVAYERKDKLEESELTTASISDADIKESGEAG